jgi:hypothetical protein
VVRDLRALVAVAAEDRVPVEQSPRLDTWLNRYLGEVAARRLPTRSKATGVVAALRAAPLPDLKLRRSRRRPGRRKISHDAGGGESESAFASGSVSSHSKASVTAASSV